MYNDDDDDEIDDDGDDDDADDDDDVDDDDIDDGGDGGGSTAADNWDDDIDGYITRLEAQSWPPRELWVTVNSRLQMTSILVIRSPTIELSINSNLIPCKTPTKAATIKDSCWLVSSHDVDPPFEGQLYRLGTFFQARSVFTSTEFSSAISWIFYLQPSSTPSSGESWPGLRVFL
ncbi:LOW QUALITY PROTEIN: hypothetical protein PoB_002238300 [Plakobranchus ocellatus]|uniref:Uncharacterized protein n=1 Tax=Plakobranchus ocellatus TaxID=259542 RepID=A0AAV3ZMR2_9GAST|nr:LOW QUALITY PROTEIN: hypothetical protein PoB_002238300 [Plakobranchus ocellatus]